MTSLKAISIAATLGIVALGASPGWSEESPMMTGEIVKIDKAAGEITMWIGAETPKFAVGTGQAGTTEVFGVKDGRLFNAVNPGQNVRFSVERTGNGQKRITRIEPRP